MTLEENCAKDKRKLKNCQKCVADKRNCPKCQFNPFYNYLSNYFEPYKTNCPVGAYYCECDPAYQYYCDKEQFKEDYGNIDPLSIPCLGGHADIQGEFCYSCFVNC